MSHAPAMPEAPAPEQTAPRVASLRAVDEVFDLRFVDPRDPATAGPRPALNRAWLRAAEALPDDPVLHQALPAYVSD